MRDMTKKLDGDLYDYPAYYDLVFGSDWKAEFDFLVRCFEKHASGRGVQRVFEPACGTGRLLYRLAKAGYDVSGLDLNARAIAYCNARLERHGFSPTCVVGDMTDFRLPRKVDAALNMINSFRHLNTEKAAVDHLECMAKVLRKGGIYVLGLHLTPTRGDPMDEEAWSARRGNLCINTHLLSTERSARFREERFTMTLDVYTPSDSWQLQNEIVFRTYTAKQMADLVHQIGGLQVVETYDFAYNINRPTKIDDETEDVVYVLKRI